ncbi:24691_t:CDS:2, partial [Entrophospora sp. SA101]
NANYIRTLCPFEDDESSVEYLCITKDANIVIYTEYKNEYFLHTYSINGKLLNSMQLSVKIEHMISSTESNSIVTTTDGEDGEDEKSFIRIYDVLSLELHHEFTVPLIANCLKLSNNDMQIWIAGNNGKLLIVSDNDYSINEYHQLSEETMEKLYENLESLGEEININDYDVEYSYLCAIGKFSGPKRYDYDFKDEKWIYHHENSTLDELLNNELSQIFKRD